MASFPCWTTRCDLLLLLFPSSESFPFLLLLSSCRPRSTTPWSRRRRIRLLLLLLSSSFQFFFFFFVWKSAFLKRNDFCHNKGQKKGVVLISWRRFSIRVLIVPWYRDHYYYYYYSCRGGAGVSYLPFTGFPFNHSPSKYPPLLKLSLPFPSGLP